MERNTPIALVTDAWETAFQELFAQARRELVLVSPFIGLEPIKTLCQALQAKDEPITVRCVTNFTPQAIAAGALHVEALWQLADCNSDTHIYHLGNLHAKVYLADTRAALITSANFTQTALSRNAEVGIWLADSPLVHSLHHHVQRLQQISTPLTTQELFLILKESERLRERQAKRGEDDLPEAKRIQEHLIRARLRTTALLGEQGSENRIFAATILYLLQERGALRTEEMHPLIQALHPELCDDSVERIIDGVRFGKRWKHMVRNAQQYLKRNGLIGYDAQTRRWFLRE